MTGVGYRLASGMTIREIAPAIGVSVPTLYRHLPAPAQEADQRGRGGRLVPALTRSPC
ncbi:helix-turn-helix domain-containing protein [Sphingobium sp. 3R8]|uniref:helix-turn-helix domain-containing protein n=1 Tax=Sphingobium sp. 3R8 TaxID=2874921 RepID=UPI001CCF984C|nr:helix-turn-helix domain-containing protein [Sphingobium sp. 3R8]MBZ9650215.1 helix-turn-helix domain-containing protein [Sphingobium sp. 3R8]